MANEHNTQVKLNDAIDALAKIKYLLEAAKYLTATNEETVTQLTLIDLTADLVERTLEAIDAEPDTSH